MALAIAFVIYIVLILYIIIRILNSVKLQIYYLQLEHYGSMYANKGVLDNCVEMDCLLVDDQLQEPIYDLRNRSSSAREEESPMNAELEVNIDFDDASSAWLMNKKKDKNCHYRYICGALTKSGNRCAKTPGDKSPRCHLHKGCLL